MERNPHTPIICRARSHLKSLPQQAILTFLQNITPEWSSGLQFGNRRPERHAINTSAVPDRGPGARKNIIV